MRSQLAGSSLSEWENPAVFGINKRRPHVKLRSYATQERALEAYSFSDFRVSAVETPDEEDPRVVDPTGRYQLLSGDQWKFALMRGPAPVPDTILEGNFPESFTSIQVPGSWELQGHGRPQYLNFDYPFPIDPPFVPADNPTGLYCTTFLCDQPFLRDEAFRSFLVIDSADSAVYAWLNGTLVGYSQDSRLPAEFEVTGLLRSSSQSNVLVLQVLKWSDGSYLEDQDMWRLPGLHRDVYLQHKPCSHIRDFLVKTPLSFLQQSQLRSAALEIAVDVEIDGNYMDHQASSSSGNDDAGVECSATLFYQNQRALVEGKLALGDVYSEVARILLDCEGPLWAARDAIQNQDRDRIGLRFAAKHSMDFTTVQLWSAEDPNLYVLVLCLRETATGRILEYEACQVGFRTACIQPFHLLHNNRPIMIKGVNRHEHNQKRGKVVTRRSMFRDARVLKQYNFNAVRCSHYPNREEWYEICAFMGIYLVDEVNCETHGFDATLSKPWLNPTANPAWAPAILDRAVRMYERDKNFPSILMWSLGNESGYGPVHLAMAGYLRQADPSRPIHYEGGGSRTAATDVICPMYARVDQAKSLAQRREPGHHRPVILCEYAHAMGNSSGNVHEYWEAFESVNGLQGGFVWDFMDQALLKTDPDSGTTFWAYGGDFGESHHDAQFCLNGIFYPDRSPKPAAEEFKYLQRPFRLRLENQRFHEHTLHLSNQQTFLPPRNLELRISLGAGLGEPIVVRDLNDFPVVEPGKGITLELPVRSFEEAYLSLQRKKDDPARTAQITVQIVTKRDELWADQGHIIQMDQLEIRYDGEIDDQVAVVPVSWPPPVRQPSRPTFRLCRETGALISFHTAEFGELLSSPLVPCFYRSPTDNDRGGSGGSSFLAQWQRAGLNKLVVEPGSLSFHGREEDEEIEVSYRLIPGPNYDATDFTWAGVGVGETGGTHWLSMDGEAEEMDGVENGAANGKQRKVDDKNKEPSKPANPQLPFAACIRVCARYRLTPGGQLYCRYVMDTHQAIPSISHRLVSLARVGIRCGVQRGMNEATWFGLGPHECYPDRKASGRLGVFTAVGGTLDKSYIRPSESGGRADVRWVLLRNPETDKGLQIMYGAPSTPAGGQMSATPFSMEALESAPHDYQLQASDYLHVHFDHAHMGLGGDDSWTPSVHAKYMVKPREAHTFDIALKAVDKCSENIDCL